MRRREKGKSGPNGLGCGKSPLLIIAGRALKTCADIFKAAECANNFAACGYVGVILAPDFSEIDGGFRVGHVKIVDCIGDDLRQRQIAEPFMVSRNDEPGRATRARGVQSILERHNVIVTERTFGVIGPANFPVAIRIVEALLEARDLLLIADM